MVEDDRLGVLGAPVLVVDFSPVLGGDRTHYISSFFLLATQRASSFRGDGQSRLSFQSVLRHGFSAAGVLSSVVGVPKPRGTSRGVLRLERRTTFLVPTDAIIYREVTFLFLHRGKFFPIGANRLGTSLLA